MAARGSSRRAAGWRAPQEPDLPAELDPASLPEHDLAGSGCYELLRFDRLDLRGRRVGGADIAECHFVSTDLAGMVCTPVRIRDCRFDGGDLSNLRAGASTLVRARVSGARLTGLHWVDGELRDVAFVGCRADLAVLRSSAFTAVLFQDCDLTGADFSGADLTGARFVDCDLTGTRFAEARLRGAELSGCTLADIDGVAHLAGAVVERTDLASLAYALAGGLGVEIRD